MHLILFKTNHCHMCLMRNLLFSKAFDSQIFDKIMEMKVKNDV